MSSMAGLSAMAVEREPARPSLTSGEPFPSARSVTPAVASDKPRASEMVARLLQMQSRVNRGSELGGMWTSRRAHATRKSPAQMPRKATGDTIRHVRLPLGDCEPPCMAGNDKDLRRKMVQASKMGTSTSFFAGSFGGSCGSGKRKLRTTASLPGVEFVVVVVVASACGTSPRRREEGGGWTCFDKNETAREVGRPAAVVVVVEKRVDERHARRLHAPTKAVMPRTVMERGAMQEWARERWKRGKGEVRKGKDEQATASCESGRTVSYKCLYMNMKSELRTLEQR